MKQTIKHMLLGAGVAAVIIGVMSLCVYVKNIKKETEANTQAINQIVVFINQQIAASQQKTQPVKQ